MDYSRFLFWWFYGTHFRKIHLFHQPVHSTFTDGYAMLLRKTELHFTGSKALIRFSIKGCGRKVGLQKEGVHRKCKVDYSQ